MTEHPTFRLANQLALIANIDGVMGCAYHCSTAGAVLGDHFPQNLGHWHPEWKRRPKTLRELSSHRAMATRRC